ncbi:hypothetical protein JHK84_045097 [Glycine max]|nr:hypothetical protein JHK86_045041 [Glycine max]KAG4951742.1 hypothetical protein JHK85_045609 [Glycine max]KAG5108190.1 hypothetical protein JHK84_045097 [Glycine max]
MGVGRVKEEKGVVWHKIEKKVPKVSEEKHPDDPLKTTDQTRNLGLIDACLHLQQYQCGLGYIEPFQTWQMRSNAQVGSPVDECERS